MHPYAAVQSIMDNSRQGLAKIAGSCFRLADDRYFVTAAHVASNIELANLRIMNPFDEADDFVAVAVQLHPTADLAVIEVASPISSKFEPFRLSEFDFKYGMQLHSFGAASDLVDSRQTNPYRVVGGIVQRDFEYRDGRYSSVALEVSCPIPKGHSGAPAFVAAQPRIVVGLSIATVQSELTLSVVTDVDTPGKREVEKVSEFTRYGVILRLWPYKDWLDSVRTS